MSGQKEEDDLDGKSKKLDYGLRRWAGCGALLIALVSYAAGFAAIAVFIGLFPRYPAFPPQAWHIVAAVLIALFSVPTVLVLSVLRHSGGVPKAAAADSLHEAVGQFIVSAIERLSKSGAK